MQYYVNIVHFLKLMRVVLKHVPFERWIQLMIGGFRTVNLAWVNKVALNGYTWLFVYASLRRYEGRFIAAHGQNRQMSGGRFLVSLKEVLCSDNIWKTKSTLKEGCDIDDAKTEEPPYMEESLASINEKVNSISLVNLTLNEQSRVMYCV